MRVVSVEQCHGTYSLKSSLKNFSLNKTIGLRFETPTELPRTLKFAFHLSGRFYSIGECYAKLDNYLPEKLNGKFEGISSLKEYFRAVNT